MNKAQMKGRAENVKGRAKQAVGFVTGDRGTQLDGTIDRAKGAVRKKVGDIKHRIARKHDGSADE